MSRTSKILWVTANRTGGGAEAVVAQLHQQALYNEYDSKWVVLCGSPPANHDDLPGMTYLSSPRASRSIFKLFYYLIQNRPNIIIYNLMHINILGAFLSFFYKANIIGVEHNILRVKYSGIYTKSLYLRFLAKLLYPRLNKIIAVSSGVKEDINTILDISLNKIEVIHNPLKNLKFKAKKARAIGYIGAHTQQKGLDTLVTSYEAYIERGGTRNLIVAGKVIDDSPVNKLITNEKLKHKVHIIGYVDNVQEFYDGIDILVVPSKWEGFCNVVGEGILSGCVVVAANCHSGPKDIIEIMSSGILFEVENNQQLSDILIKFDSIKLMNVPKPKNMAAFNSENILTKYLACCE